MSNENDEVIAHSAVDAPGIGGADVGSCVIQFNLTDDEPEVLAHQADEDEEDLAGCGIQFNSN
jgi:hypothetical protein